MKVVWLNFNVNECSCLISHSRIYEVTSRENVCSVPSILKISGTLSSRMRVRRRRSTLGYKQQIGQKNNTVWMKTDCNFRNEMGYVNGEAKLAGVDVITWPWNRNGWEKLRVRFVFCRRVEEGWSSALSPGELEAKFTGFLFSLLSYLVDSYDPLLLDDEERSTEIEFVTTSKQGQFSENSLAVFDENRTLVAQAET